MKSLHAQPDRLSGVSNFLYEFGLMSFTESVSLKWAKPIGISYNTSMMDRYVTKYEVLVQVNAHGSEYAVSLPCDGVTATFDPWEQMTRRTARLKTR
jgi:hypothetical protein